MKRKPLEGIESLLFVLGVGAGYVLQTQNFSWWIVVVVVMLLGYAMGELVNFLRRMNQKLV
jgi:high-affinity Fe2+/Pb2+ permease